MGCAWRADNGYKKCIRSCSRENLKASNWKTTKKTEKWYWILFHNGQSPLTVWNSEIRNAYKIVVRKPQRRLKNDIEFDFTTVSSHSMKFRNKKCIQICSQETTKETEKWYWIRFHDGQCRLTVWNSEIRNKYKIVVGKPRRRLKNDIEMAVTNFRCNDERWIRLAHFSCQWQKHERYLILFCYERVTHF
jgi:NAD-dependent dihydropyrimidine dehydrogenase PreA subunit